MIHLRNQYKDNPIAFDEVVGLVKQMKWIDPLGKSEYEHKGYTEEELIEMDYVGIYWKPIDKQES